LKDELERVLGGPYPVAPPSWPGRQRAERWLKALKASLAARTKAAHYLATHHPWDFFMVHVMETDSVQHQMWHLLDGVERPRYRVALEGNPILEI
jgi:predicted AlkP superfamily phosphohydrolase/phosphomutase